MAEGLEIEEEVSALDHVDACMKMLGISLNLLDPDGTFKGMPSEETLIKIMQAAREDYRKLSDAILALRDEEEEDENHLDFAEHLPPAVWKSSQARICSLTAACLSCHAEMHGEWQGEPPHTLVCPSCGACHTIEERLL